MSYTNSTTNYNLPQWVGTDKPTWLNDMNGAFSDIDTAMKANADSASQAYGKAVAVEESLGDVSGDVTDLGEAVDGIQADITNNIRPGLEAATKTADDALAFPDQGFGEEFTVWSAFGFVTTGATEIDLFVPTPKVFAENGNGISVGTLKIMLKSAIGNLYTGGSYFDFLADPDTQVDVSMAGDCQIRIKLTNTSGFATNPSDVNNKPVIAYGTLKFHVL